MKTEIWHGCYDGSWKGLITDESFAHPAKFTPGLVQRILREGLARGWWKKGDLIGDPFGGIAGGGIMAGYAGLNWIGVELEPKFVAMGNQNLQRHGPIWLGLGEVSCVKLVQGDSRRFAEIVGREVAGGEGAAKRDHAMCSAGNIQQLPAGDVDGVLTSPPYVSGGHHADQTGSWGGLATVKGLGTKDVAGYGNKEGQIGQLKAGDVDAVLTSPPYAESVHGGNGIDVSKLTGNKAGKNTQASAGGYGQTTGQIGELAAGAVEAVVTSPPWEKNTEGVKRAGKFKDPAAFAGNGKGHYASKEAKLASMQRDESRAKYGKSDGQLGETEGETYWQAMRLVYAQCRLALKPGGVMAVVVKSYVKGGAIVDLPEQTWRLLMALGFEPVARARAMLVKETVRQGLFAEERKVKARKSFFRRLAESKGSPAIDWEEVLVVSRPR